MKPTLEANATMQNGHSVAVFIPVKDCPELLMECLPKLTWADEVFVVDASVTTAVSEMVAARFPRYVYVKDATPDLYVRLKTLIPRIRSDYILFLCSDEFCTPELAAEVRAVLKKPCDCDGFFVPQVYYNFGVCFGPGGATMRLFHRERHQLPLKGSAHSLPTVPGKTGRLTQPFHHVNNPKLGMIAVKHFHYEAITAARLTDAELEARRHDQLAGWRLILHVIKRLIKINGRFLRDFLRHRHLGFAGLCHSYDNMFRSIAEDVCVTEEWRMRRGLVERGNRGYF